MQEQVDPVIEYYAHIDLEQTGAAHGPGGVFRRIRGNRDEAFGRDGTWIPNDWFHQRDSGGAQVGIVEPITPEQAAVIIHRWREAAVVPFVEGVDIPPLPATDEPAPVPGVGPVSPTQAQAIGDEWVNGARGAQQHIRAGIYEFDLGYLVYALTPAHTDLSVPPQSVGAGRGVIDRATGELSVWPSLPFAVVAQMYRQNKAAARGKTPQDT